MNTLLYYIHDPMCSWCWGYKPVWDALQKSLPEHIQVEYVVGGLAPDSSAPMPDEQQKMIQAHWRTITHKLGTKFNFDFWDNNIARRSTYNSCRAVIAAKFQGAEQPMIAAIQQGYYLRALNPSDKGILAQLFNELANADSNLNVHQFMEDLNSSEVQTELMRQIQLSRMLTNQGFPSLVLEKKDKHRLIIHDYKDYRGTLKDILS